MTECHCPAARGGCYPHTVEAHDGAPDLRPVVERMLVDALASEVSL